MSYLSIFRQEFEKILKKLFSCLKSAPLRLSKCNIRCKTKELQIWDQMCLIWMFLACNFEKTVIVSDISTLKFVKMQSFVPKLNS